MLNTVWKATGIIPYLSLQQFQVKILLQTLYKYRSYNVNINPLKKLYKILASLISSFKNSGRIFY